MIFPAEHLTEEEVQRQFQQRPTVNTRRGRVSDRPLACPFTIAIDTAEQLPYSFRDINADSDRSYRPLVIQTQRKHLPIGEGLSIDYSIVGYETAIGIERKSHEDFRSSVGKGHDHFDYKLSKINELFSCFTVMVEAEWSTILYRPPDWGEVHPKALFGSYLAWMQEYPNIHWVFMGTRRLAELTTFRILHRWWKRLQKSEKQGEVE